MLDATPFYGEGGGQAGDVGVLRADSRNGAACSIEATVLDTRKAAGGALIVHRVRLESGQLTVGQQVGATSCKGETSVKLSLSQCLFVHSVRLQPGELTIGRQVASEFEHETSTICGHRPRSAGCQPPT